ncbi:hypothetical protein NHX12_018213 [Muraenolepis orangiensis]|uniref:Sushi domain-containing protein n=1 Tax=Muraenolepis orangiensis TaxID=630683 RepID=A0A9Q0F0K8_9TELE|nr:hypothetical protein NHX12_018213 [Muraenolepis orangiensis]
MHHLLSVLLLSLFTLVKSAEGGCSRPALKPHVEALGLQQFSPPGTRARLTCVPGYTSHNHWPFIVCTIGESWSTAQFMCQPKSCGYIYAPQNGDMHFEDIVYLSRVNFTCNEGYNLHGVSSVVCQENATWSAPRPECKALTCGPAPVPVYTILVFDVLQRSGESAVFGTKGTYKCLPPMILIGNPRAECTISGKWTEAPVCQSNK